MLREQQRDDRVVVHGMPQKELQLSPDRTVQPAERCVTGIVLFAHGNALLRRIEQCLKRRQVFFNIGQRMLG